ncbi:hypothetical protein ALC57_10381 [Trachymyrmex cornetzi]|uniref:Uncharacterized protein n=1 Tax=Trachymyrmex cornetzi TaxID=471704 RepID=A0A151J4B1_9HYME|nr:hypothetical protein ALC57_10381 [Trachymyrmex cornetzi]
MYLHEFIHITYNFDYLWNFLCNKEVRKEILCPRCKNVLTLTNARENHIFHCTKHYYKVTRTRKRRKVTCNFKISAFHGTWFEQARLELPTICRFIAYFLMMQPPRHTFLMEDLQLENHTVVDWTKSNSVFVVRFVCKIINIERLWRDMRAGIPRYGIRDNHYIHYIAEFLFKRVHNYSDRIHAFFDIISALYPLHDN